MSDEEKPSFACDECEQSFPKAHGLKIHRSKMHKKSVRKEKSLNPHKKKMKKEVESTPDGHEESSSSHDGEEKAVVKPKKKEAEDDGRGSPARKKEEKALPKKKAASPKKEDGPFKVGALLEGENNDLELPLYLDTIYEVEYVGPSKDTLDMHRCRMVAFHGRPMYEWNTHELHDKRRVKDDEEEEFKMGERVHVLIKNRWGINRKGKRVGDLDGHLAKVGVWVKATVLEVEGDGRIKVEHANWNASADKKKTMTIQATFDSKDVRKDWHNN